MFFDVKDILKTDGARAEIKGVLSPSGDYSVDDIDFNAADFCGEIVNIGGVLELTGQVSGSFAVPCARCAKTTEQGFSVSVREALSNGEVESEDPESVIIFSGTVINLGDVLWPEVLLELETRYLCKPDCKGLCFRCGADLNEGPCGCTDDEIDPRLAGLKDLLQ